MTAPLVGSARRVFELALGQMLWAPRASLLGLAAGAPILLALVTRLTLSSGTAVVQINGRPIDSEAVFSAAITLLYLRFIVPAIGVFYGTSLIADEIEEKTITYLFTRPIPRGAIVLGKYLAYILCTTCVVLPSVAVVFMVMVPFDEMAPLFGSFLRNLGVLALGLGAYGALSVDWHVVPAAAGRRPLVRFRMGTAGCNPAWVHGAADNRALPRGRYEECGGFAGGDHRCPVARGPHDRAPRVSARAVIETLSWSDPYNR
jgi:ABC-2 family transporter